MPLPSVESHDRKELPAWEPAQEMIDATLVHWPYCLVSGPAREW